MAMADVNVKEAWSVHQQPAPVSTDYPSTSNSPCTLEESGRGCRNKRKQLDPVTCPVCSVTVRPGELQTHYFAEIAKLEKLSGSGSKQRRSAAASASTSSETTARDPPESVTPEKCWETYQTVKANRQSRLKVKSRKRKADETAVCPVCNQHISGEVNQHVEDCLRKSGQECTSSEDEEVDVVDDFGEYEWAGQHRVRAVSMLEGGYAAAGVGTRLRNSEEEEDLVVDGDDSDKYGPAQYTERDIMLVNRDEDKDQTALRLAIIGGGEEQSGIATESLAAEEDESTNEQNSQQEEPTISEERNPVIEALKQRVRELEQCENNKSQYKCLICMGRYRTPVISICCWHVHCELCWLKTLGIKKLCPQCNMITSPTDLRRVYI